MANVNFVVRSTKASGTATVYVRVRNGKTDFKVSTKIEMPLSWWGMWTNETNDFNKNISKTIKSEQEGERANAIAEQLKAIYNLIIADVDKYAEYTSVLATDTITKYHNSRKLDPSSAQFPDDAVAYLEKKIETMKSGDMEHKGKTYDANTIKVWNSFLKLLRGFVKYRREKLYLSQINKSVADSFSKYLKNCDYLPKTRNKYIICFKAMITFAFGDDVISNKDKMLDFFNKSTVNDNEKAARIYLNETEIQAFYDMKLEAGSMYDKVRDIFLCGCYTAQRVSDYGNLSEENFITTNKGNKVVSLTQTKTDNAVLVPYLSDNLEAIVVKYGGDIPKVSDVIINRYIKQIGKILSESVPTLAQMEKTILTQKEKANEKAGKMTFERSKAGEVLRPRYEMICTHTARRSAITNMYLRHIFTTPQLMSISGHKSEKAFADYLCMSLTETADEIAGLLKENDVKRNANLF